MFFVYVLRSLKNKKRYIGFTARNIEERLLEHNSGKADWTKRNLPFELSYAQDFETQKEALEFENFLKSGQGRQCLDELDI